ncbi:MAG: DUF2336 domain-containing protein [Alphaproteobacteria bacterium]|nr:DUF2336 domain-containing protein [Alphaproteobacteria bacterium]
MNIQRRNEADYAKAKALARDKDPNVRRKLAAREDVRPEILYFLAEDDDVEVRATIAANKRTPAHADLLLASDSDDEVRQRLAQKIGRLVPNLPEGAKGRVRDLTLQALEVLMQDRLPRVRQMLAEELKATAHAPTEVIRRLARDSEIEVAVPVLEFSPLLTDADLLAIIAASPAEAAITAISRRDGVAEPVSDAIVETESVPAIAALLANPVAQIREDTLDRIVAKAPGIRSWHEPLARRPKLPPQILHKLTDFLAASLLQTLQNRGDLDPETAKAVAEALHDRIQQEGSETMAGETDEKVQAEDEVRNLQAKGKLDEKAISKAVGEGRHFFVTAALAALGRIPTRIVERILNAGNAAAVASLSWKAGLGARLASRIQTRIAHIPPTEALSAETDAYPMDEDAMRLQLDSFNAATEAAEEEEPPADEPDWAEGPRRAGPVEPDWSLQPTARKGRAAVEPDWAAKTESTDKPIAEPDWAREEAPAAKPEDAPDKTEDMEDAFEALTETDPGDATPAPEDEDREAEENETR